jgi:signal transduction histidine kinase
MNSYPVQDTGADGNAGVVIILHDSTVRRSMTQRLEETNQEIEKNRTELRTALDELSSLIQRVAKEKNFGIRFHNPNLISCYEAKKCNKLSCPCYGKRAARCWQIVGTHCGGQVQGEFAQKCENCVECAVFQASTQNPVFQIGEHFNNMMSILEFKNGELENAYNDLKIAQGQVIQQEKMASIGQLAAGVAHEINNPTGFIMSNLGSLQKYVDRLTEFIRIQTESLAGLPAESAEAVAQQRKALKIDFITDDLKSLVKESLDGADRIKKIVQDLKNFSRVDESELKMADINSGIESTINIVWNELKYKATLNKEYGDLPQTKCNPGQLNQIFMNILVNAAHAIEKQGEIRVRTWTENDTIKVTISDTGSGIPKDKINRIFEPFFTTKEVGKGTGLGLSIAYDIVKKHHGSIDVESEVGKGTTFTVMIPITGS